jgi:hypothetical protein
MTVPEHAQADAVAAIVGPGAERIRLTARLAELDGVLKPLIRTAAEAGVRPSRIIELTGLSKNTVRAWSQSPAG